MRPAMEYPTQAKGRLEWDPLRIVVTWQELFTAPFWFSCGAKRRVFPERDFVQFDPFAVS